MMENNWEPRLGQKVVCISQPASNGNWNPIKGEHYIITDVDGKDWCQVNHFHWWYCSLRFAPIPDQYPDMTAEIAQQFKEHPDTTDVPVKQFEISN